MTENKGIVTIFLVRHAQTSGNVGLKIMEAEEDVLTDLGKIQTNLLGLHLSSTKFDHVFSSDYARAMKTAEGILKLSKLSSTTPITPSEMLREVNFGTYETASYKETFAYCKSLNKSIFEWTFPEGESFPEAGERMLNFVKETCSNLLVTHEGKQKPNILMISHSAAIALFSHALCKPDVHSVIGIEGGDLKLMRNACYMKFEVEFGPELKNGGRPSVTFRVLEQYYCKHLNCIKNMNVTDEANPLLKFANSGSGSKEYVGCIQQ